MSGLFITWMYYPLMNPKEGSGQLIDCAALSCGRHFRGLQFKTGIRVFLPQLLQRFLAKARHHIGKLRGNSGSLRKLLDKSLQDHQSPLSGDDGIGNVDAADFDHGLFGGSVRIISTRWPRLLITFGDGIGSKGGKNAHEKAPK
jgi:hypothetical protein